MKNLNKKKNFTVVNFMSFSLQETDKRHCHYVWFSLRLKLRENFHPKRRIKNKKERKKLLKSRQKIFFHLKEWVVVVLKVLMKDLIYSMKTLFQIKYFTNVRKNFDRSKINRKSVSKDEFFQQKKKIYNISFCIFSSFDYFVNEWER